MVSIHAATAQSHPSRWAFAATAGHKRTSMTFEPVLMHWELSDGWSVHCDLETSRDPSADASAAALLFTPGAIDWRRPVVLRRGQ